MPICEECRKVDGTIQIKGDLDWYCKNCNAIKKECRGCHRELSIHEFEKNQRSPNGVRSRRSECRDCRKGKKGARATDKKAFEKNNPKPPIGDTFQCPICVRMFTVNKTNVNLDHDNTTGEIRGWICADCNTGMGKMRDDISVFARAIL